MRGLRIIVVSPEPPDPFGNAVGRWYYVLAKGLCERGHHVRWFAAYTRSDFAEMAAACFKDGQVELKLYAYPKRPGLTGKWQTMLRPYSHFISESLTRDFREALKQGYDVLHLESAWAGWLGLDAARSVLSVLSLASVDFAGTIPTSIAGVISRVLMSSTERRLISKYETVRVLTSRDARIVRGYNRTGRIVTIPLAIDPDLYRFQFECPPEAVVGLIGSMNWLPTRSAAVRLITSIWPRVHKHRRDARLLLVGWGAQDSLAKYAGTPGLTILEDVPDPEPYFRQMSVLAYPVAVGSGMKVKVLEAMAYGVPVVTTREGIEGIDAVDGIHASLTDDDDGIAEGILNLLEDKTLGRQMRLAARRLLEERYSPMPVMAQIENLYDGVASP
jgi:glycosyltransferase involved in cell wall biosynthesis